VHGFDIEGEAAIDKEIAAGRILPVNAECVAGVITELLNNLSEGRRQLDREMAGLAMLFGVAVPKEDPAKTVMESKGFLDLICRRLSYEVQATEGIRAGLAQLLSIFGVTDEPSLIEAIKRHNASGCPQKGA